MCQNTTLTLAVVLEEQLPRDPALALAPSSISPLKRFEVEDIAVRTLLYGNVKRLQILRGKWDANRMRQPGDRQESGREDANADREPSRL